MLKTPPPRLLAGVALLAAVAGCVLPHRIDVQSGTTQQPRNGSPASQTSSRARKNPPPEFQTMGKEPAAAMPLPALPALNPPPPARVARAERSSPPPPATARKPVATESPARVQLRQLEQRTGLSDAEHLQLTAAQARLAAGDESGALTAAQTLQAALDGDSRSHVVSDGENLFGIAGRPEIYGNSALWPLLWRANQSMLHEPWQASKGMRLQVPVHPTIAEVSGALAYSREHNVLEGSPK